MLAFLDASRDLETKSLNKLRRSTAVALVPPSAQSLEEGNFDRTLRLTLAAAVLSNDPKFELTPELHSFLVPTCLQLRLRATFSHELHLTTLALSPREPIVVIGSSDRSLSVRHVKDGSLITRLTGHNEGINYAAFSSDGTFLATASGDEWTSNDDSVCIWSTASWSLVSKFKQYHLVKWCGVTSDGRFCFAVDQLNDATVYSVVQKNELLSVKVERRLAGDRSDEPCPVIMVDSHALFIAVTDKGGVFYQLTDDGIDPLPVNDSARIRLICASADQQLIACFRHGGSIQLLSTDGLKEISSFSTNIIQADHIQFITGDQRVLVSAANGFEVLTIADGTIVGSGTFIGKETADDGLRLAPAPLGNRAIVREQNGDWTLIDTESGSEIHREAGHADVLDYVYVAFSPDGEIFAVSAKSEICEVRATGTGLKLLSLVGHKGGLRGMEFLASNSHIITISDDWTGRVWANRRLRGDIEVMKEAAQHVLWIGNALVAVGANRTINFFDGGSCTDGTSQRATAGGRSIV